MVFGFLLGQLRGSMFKEEEEPKVAQVKPENVKSDSVGSFLKTPETRQFMSEWKGKGYTKRGITKLFSALWGLHNSDKNVRGAAKDILSSLIGEDGLGKVLGALKLIPEGIMKLKL